jgi:SAM-dependent methyltransferase
MLPAHVEKNRTAWTQMSEWFREPGHRSWGTAEIEWGLWNLPEREVQAFGPLEAWRGKDVLEMGCGTAYFSAWFAKLGARPVGIDITPAQLENARAFQREFGLEFPLIEGSAEEVPLPGASFDLVFSEYGASIWCDAYRWIPEAARLLRPDGRLVFLRNTPLSTVCMPDEGQVSNILQRDWRSIGRIEWPNDGSVEFILPTGDMVRLLRSAGFNLLDLIELFPAPGVTTRFEYMNPEWASRWPSEEIWVAEKR